MNSANEKNRKLRQILRESGSMAVAFSGGVDSTFLLQAAAEELGDRVLAVTMAAPWVPEAELREAEAFCRGRGIPLQVVEVSPEEIPGFTENPPDRCYLCKKAIFRRLAEAAARSGMTVLAEGSNLDDEGDYRPGMRALAELGICSPLRMAGLTKQEIRELSRELGLPTWDKPSFACLASRFAYGEIISREKLAMVEQGEALLRALGFPQYRVRVHGELARIEVPPEELERLFAHREEILTAFTGLGFLYVTMDLGGFRSGSMNDVLKKHAKI